MAAKRQERLLERQRGAGTRQIKNTGFDLLFPGQDHTVSALLVPQRSGRSRRTPQPELLPQKSGRARKAPQPEIINQRSLRLTPAPEGPPQQSSTKRAPVIANAKKRGRPKRIQKADGDEKGDDERGAAPKKRKLNVSSRKQEAAEEIVAAGNEVAIPEVQVTDSQPQEPDRTVLQTAGVKTRGKRNSIRQQSLKKTKSQREDSVRTARKPQRRGPKPKPKPKPPELVEPVVIETPEPPEYSRITTAAFRNREGPHELVSLEPVEGLESLESVEADATKPTFNKGKRAPNKKEKRKYAETKVADERVNNVPEGREFLTERTQPETKAKRGRKPGHRKKALEETEPIYYPTEQDDVEVSQLGENASRGVEGAVAEPREHIASVGKVAESQDKPKARRKKRKSIGQQSGRPKKRTTFTTTPSKPTGRKATATKSAKEPKSKSTATAPFQGAKAKSTQLPTYVERTGEEPANAIGKPSDNEVQEPEPVQPKKRGRPRKTDALRKPPPAIESSQPRTQKAKRTKATVPRKPPKNTIPITYYAPPSPSASDSDAMVDPLSNAAPAPGATKGINAVDVLAQTCSEMLAKTSATLAEKANELPDQRAEYMRRKKTVDIYSEELGDRLLQLTTTLNANTALTAQVRKAAAEERALKKEVKALEAEREKVRLKKDEMLKGKKARELEELLSGIKGAVRKGMEMEAAAKMTEG